MTPFIRRMRFITEPRTGNVQFKASKLKVLHENGNHGRADDSRYVAHHLVSLSLKQHSMIRVVRIPHIGTKREPLTKAASPNKLVHVVATYDAFQAVLGFLCRHVLGCLLDVCLPRIMERYEDIRRTSLLSEKISATSIGACA